MHLRLFSSLIILLSIILAVACGRTGQVGRVEPAKKDERIDLDQNVTTQTKPQDVIFSDFAKNWRKFVSQTPEIVMPVVALGQRQGPPWEPVVSNECVFSQDAGGLVPQVTLIWNEPVQV